jgi:hypothetical protein
MGIVNDEVNLDADEPKLGRDGFRHRVEWQGNRLKWQVFQLLPAKRTPGRRRACRGFTQASRFRMLCHVSSISWEEAGMCYFVTLTYPDWYYLLECWQLSSHRTRMWEYVEKGCGCHVCGLWRTEWKRRKSGENIGRLYPHVHIIVFRCQRLRNRDVNEWWRKSIGWEGYVNTDVKRMESAKQVACYVAKYCAKDQSILGIASNLTEIPVGRAWGILRRELFPRAKLFVGTYKDCPMIQALRDKALKDRPAVNQYGNESFTLLGTLAKCIGETLAASWVDDEVCGW